MASPLVMIFGESVNDGRALRHIVRALLPADRTVDCKAIREPGTLARNASGVKRKKLARAIAVKAAHEARTRKVAVVVHEDSDACEDAHKVQADRVVAELLGEGIAFPVPAIAAWEIETWWMLFPEAMRATRNCWAAVDYSNRRVGGIENAKEVLTRDLRPKATTKGRCPDYSEADSERIAEEIANLRLCDDLTRVRRSSSLDDFRTALLLAFP